MGKKSTENKIPIISIITTFYNAEKFIWNTLNSINQQIVDTNLFDFEYVIVDDKSPDSSRRIVEDFIKTQVPEQNKHKWKIYEPEENLGCGGARKYGIDHEFTFLYVGRIVKDKGINELVEAFNELYSSHPESRLLLVGSKEDNLDPISEKSKEIIEHLPSIIMTGPVFGRDLVYHYSAADCFVLPSYREGFPNTPIEAGAMGLPCIVTDINGSREIIEDGNNGIIVPSKDSSALCKAMTNLIENKCLCYSMADNARPMIVSRFEQGFVRKCLYDFYNGIM